MRNVIKQPLVKRGKIVHSPARWRRISRLRIGSRTVDVYSCITHITTVKYRRAKVKMHRMSKTWLPLALSLSHRFDSKGRSVSTFQDSEYAWKYSNARVHRKMKALVNPAYVLWRQARAFLQSDAAACTSWCTAKEIQNNTYWRVRYSFRLLLLLFCPDAAVPVAIPGLLLARYSLCRYCWQLRRKRLLDCQREGRVYQNASNSDQKKPL